MLGVSHHSAQTYISSTPNGWVIAVLVIFHTCPICETWTNANIINEIVHPLNLSDAILQYIRFYNMCCFDLWTAQGDVYPVEPYQSSSINQILDAHWGVLDDDDVSI